MSKCTSKLLENLNIVLEGLENDLFEEGANKMFYNGVEFTRSDWRNLQSAINQIKKNYDANKKSSKKFLEDNKEYNRTMRMIGYYKNKPVKKERDYVRLEKLERKLNRLLEKKDTNEKVNMRIKWLKNQTERQRRIEETKERRLEDEFGYDNR